MNQTVFPQSVDELQHLLRTASAGGKPLYVYRRGIAGGVTVDLSKLDEIMEIDAANLVATVEPGVTLGKLAGMLAERKLRFIPADTPFYHDKTVGQLFYEGCSNLSSLKYGSTKHFLMGSEVVLPTGELLTTGGKTVKNVTGYDFTRFFNSPFTDYGITVKFLLKLLPLPQTRRSLAVTFAGVEALLAFVRDLKDSRVVPAYLVWVDDVVQAIFNEQPQGQLVLLEFDGLREETAELSQLAATLIQKHGGIIREETDGSGHNATKWRRLYRQVEKYIVTDEHKMAFTAQREFIGTFYRTALLCGIKAGLFGQLAEGKLNIVLDTATPDNVFLAKAAGAVAAAGGICAGKYDRLAGKKPAGVLAVLEQRAKAAFDPQHVLNRFTVAEVD